MNELLTLVLHLHMHMDFELNERDQFLRGGAYRLRRAIFFSWKHGAILVIGGEVLINLKEKWFVFFL